MQIPYLEGEIRDRFDGWLAETLSRMRSALTFTEIRKGVQALSEIYVERRGEGRIAERAIDGQGKRAALATYYAALHFLTAHHAVVMLGEDGFGPVRRVIDLGCGSGAVGAAIVLSLPPRPRLLGVDRSGWALDETRHTWRTLGLEGRAERGVLPEGLPKAGPGDLLALGWVVSELSDEGRHLLLRRLESAVRRRAALLLLEPLSTRVSPWWPDWEDRLGALGVRSELIRIAIERPEFILDMDKAARLDHQVIGARVFASP